MATGAKSEQPDFSALLRRARQAAGLTQEQLAERANVSARGISDIERGVARAPRSDTLDLLADALNLSVEEREFWARSQKRLSSRSASTPTTGAAPPSPTGYVPAPLTTFIGREREIDEVAGLLRRPDVRLLTLTGPGGIGKTRLAIAVSGLLGHEFPDGIIIVGLAPLSSAGLVIPTIAARLSLLDGGGQSILDRLVEYFASRRALLVLDNAEHVLDAAPDIAALLSAAPSLTVLATSRIALHLSGEHLYDVPTLEIPDLQRMPVLNDVSQVASVRLFIERAQLTQPDFQLATANVAVVSAICQQLDGLPLALELAAARIRNLPPDMLYKRLDRRLPFLTGGPRDHPARQQTLRSTIAWSYDLLSGDERHLFRRLSAFRGGWTPEAADAVAANGKLDILDELERLVEQSLIRVAAQSDGTVRYSMLETIREFGLEQLVDNGEEGSVRQRHAQHVLDLVESLERLFAGPEQIAALDRLEQEHSNIRAAIDWFVTRRQAEPGLRLAGSLWMFWQIRGHLSEGRQQYQRLLVLPQDGVPPKVVAHALTGAGLLTEWQGEFDATVELQDEALSIWWDLPLTDQHDAWRSLASLGNVAYTRGDLVGAQALYEEMLALAKRVGSARGIASAYLLLGNVVADHGLLDEAVRLFETSHARAVESDDIWLQSLSMGNLAYMLLYRGDLEQAKPLFEAVLEIERRMGHKRHMAASMVTIGRVELLQGQTDRAATLIDEGLVLASQIGSRQVCADARRLLGDVARQLGDLELAERHCREGLRIAWSVGHMLAVLASLESLATIAVDRGDLERAVRLCSTTEHQREQLAFPLQPLERPAYDRLQGRIRRPLSVADFERSWSDGRSMSLEAAIDYAMEPIALSQPTQPREAAPAGLTPREIDVLRLVAQGLTDAEVAEHLFMARRTVNTHLTSIYTKLGVSSRAGATRFAVEQDIT